MAVIMMHGNILNLYVRAERPQRCPSCLLLLSWRNWRLCGHRFEHSPTWPKAPRWHDEIRRACFCYGLCDSQDEMLTRGSGWFLCNLMSTTFAWLMTHSSSPQKRGFCHTNTLQISTMSLIQIPLDSFRWLLRVWLSWRAELLCNP